MSVFRYKWAGIDVNTVNGLVDPEFPISASDPSVLVTIDITVDESQKSNVDEAMGEQGWTYLEDVSP